MNVWKKNNVTVMAADWRKMIFAYLADRGVFLPTNTEFRVGNGLAIIAEWSTEIAIPDHPTPKPLEGV